MSNIKYPNLEKKIYKKLPFEIEFINKVLVDYLFFDKKPYEIEQEYLNDDYSTGAYATKILKNFGINYNENDYKNLGLYKGIDKNIVIEYLKTGNEQCKNIADFLELKKQENFKNVENIILKKNPQNTIQKIYYGAPGTGKSYAVSQLIKEYYDCDEKENPYLFRTTIYQDYSYYDFIGNIMPKNEEDKITYEFKPGPFTLALEKALKNPEYPVFLVVEEMSRGNIASIFGDIFQLLDRKDGISDYSITNTEISKYINRDKNISEDELKTWKIYLPKNLHIIGTVNTSDQNVNVMDTAFKRRFDFAYTSVSPARNEKDEVLRINNYTFKLKEKDVEIPFEWTRFYMALNKFIELELGLSEDKQIGEFFVKFNENDEENYEALKNKLLHYLWEDVINMSFEENTTLFKKEIKTFARLYNLFEKKENIFSQKFIEMYSEDFKLDINKLDESYI